MTLKLRPIGRERVLLEREGIATRIAPLLDRLEEEIHDDVKTWELHNMPNQGDEVTLCTAISLHYVSFHADLVARER